MSQIVEIKSGATAALISTKGAEIISFKGADGRERMWQADPAVWGRHAPVLFPVCCKAKNDSVIIDGVTYPMEKHGFVRDWEYEIADRSADSVDLVMIPDEASKKMYPFEYELHVCFSVSTEKFSCSFVVVNKSDKAMPFCVGGHPAFITSFEEDEHLEDCDIVFGGIENGRISNLTSEGEICSQEFFSEAAGKDRFPLKHSYFDERDTLIFNDLKYSCVKLMGRKSGRGIKFDFEEMPVLAIWTKTNANADYVCLEPWQGLPAGVNESPVLEDKPFAVKLQPGETFKTSFSAEIV